MCHIFNHQACTHLSLGGAESLFLHKAWGTTAQIMCIKSFYPRSIVGLGRIEAARSARYILSGPGPIQDTPFLMFKDASKMRPPAIPHPLPVIPNGYDYFPGI